MTLFAISIILSGVLIVMTFLIYTEWEVRKQYREESARKAADETLANVQQAKTCIHMRGSVLQAVHNHRTKQQGNEQTDR
jgi:hypothetical protein